MMLIVFVIFYPSFCEFQEKDSRKMIGRSKVKDGLYHHEDLSGQIKKKQCFPVSLLAKPNKDVL